VVADGRFLPFRQGFFDYAWSYSVLQHFAREDVAATLAEVDRVVRDGGIVRIQMANGLGVRSFYHMARRGFRPPENFDVRYWTPAELRRAFAGAIGETRLAADCYLGLGLQWSDYASMGFTGKAALIVSEGLRKASVALPPLAWFADSLFCTARRSAA
jgi:SAM-dependent methyltransferase